MPRTPVAGNEPSGNWFVSDISAAHIRERSRILKREVGAHRGMRVHDARRVADKHHAVERLPRRPKRPDMDERELIPPGHRERKLGADRHALLVDLTPAVEVLSLDSGFVPGLDAVPEVRAVSDRDDAVSVTRPQLDGQLIGAHVYVNRAEQVPVRIGKAVAVDPRCSAHS